MKFALETLLSALLLISLSGTAQQLAPHYHIKVAGTSFHRITTDASGNFYVYGAFDDLEGKNLGRLLKLDAQGKPVAGFRKLYADGIISDVVIQADLKILISGEFTRINGVAVSPIVRLNADGSIDGTFSCPLSKHGNMELQSTGKIIVLTNGVFERLNSNGSIDHSFNFQNYVSNFSVLQVAPDNSIYFANYSTVHKLKPDGADDLSFQVGTGASNSHISALEIQTDGKVLVGGSFNSYNSVASRSMIRLNANGSVDNSFSAGNKIEGQLFQITQRSNGKLLIGGQFYQYGGQAASLVELNNDGTLSRNIAVVSINNITTILEGSDSKVTIAGEFNTVNGIPVFGTCRFNTNYTMDQSFAPRITYNNSNGLQLLVDNGMKNTLLGNYSTFGIYNGTSLVKGKVLRANALGKFDTKFAPKFSHADVYKGYVQDDGKVIVSGAFGNINWEVLRLNADGSKDGTFNIGSGSTTNGVSTLIYAIKKIGNLIFMGGSFTHFNGVASQSLVAVNDNGAIVKTFSALPTGSQINEIVTQSDGKIILMGFFTFGSEKLNVVRLHANGSLDDSFHRLKLLQSPSHIAVDPSDNIYLSGESLHPDGSLLKSLIRLNRDGVVDGSFNVGSGFSPWAMVNLFELLPDGRIAVGGHFDHVQGIEQPGFAILNNNGQLIPQQQPFFGKGSAVVDMFLKNGQLFLAGKFKTRDYTEAYAFVKLLLEGPVLPPLPSNVSVSLTSPGALSVNWTANSSDQLAFVVERSVNNQENFVVVDTVEANVNQYKDNISPNQFRAYRVRAINDAGYSPYSNIGSLKWTPAPIGNVNLTLTTPAAGKAVLLWTNTVTYHDGFIIERSSQPDAGYVRLDSVAATATTFTDVTNGENPYYYRVLAYNANGTIKSNSASTIITGLESISGNEISVYPNPARQYVFISAGDQAALTSLNVVNSDGRVLSCADHFSEGAHELDLTGLAPGIYLLKVTVNGKHVTRRIVKE